MLEGISPGVENGIGRMARARSLGNIMEQGIDAVRPPLRIGPAIKGAVEKRMRVGVLAIRGAEEMQQRVFDRPCVRELVKIIFRVKERMGISPLPRAIGDIMD